MRFTRRILLLPLLLLPAAARSAPPSIVDITPVESGPGLLVAEPAPKPGAEDLAAFGAGCARIVNFHAAGLPAFGKSVGWSNVDMVRRELDLPNLQLSERDAEKVAAPLGLTHVAIGSIAGKTGDIALTYRVYDVKAHAAVGEPVTVTGTEQHVSRALETLAADIAGRLGQKAPTPAAVTPSPSPADITLLGRMPWSLDETASVGDLDAAEQLSARAPLAALMALRAASALAPRRAERLAARVPNGVPGLAELARYMPAQLQSRAALVRSLNKEHDANALLATAAAALEPEGSRERMLAAARIVRCAPDNAEAWRYLAAAFGDVAQTVRKSRWWADIPADEQQFLVAVYPLAVNAAARAAKLDPRSPKAWTRLAISATFAGEMAAADEALQQALKLDPDHANSYRWAMQMYQEKWGGDAEDLAATAQAISRRTLRPAGTAIALAKTMKAVGFEKEARTTLTRTVTDLTGVLTKYPKDADTLTDLAEARETLGNREAELAVRRQLVEVVPEDVSARNALANVLFALDHYEEALKEAREIARLDPKNAQARVTMAYSLRELKRTEEAEAAAREAIRLGPTAANARYVLALILGDQKGHTEESLSAFREAVRLSPYWIFALRDFGKALHGAKQYGEAEAVLLRAVATAPRNSTAYQYLAMTYRDSRQWDRAADALTSYLGLIPDSAWAYRNLGDVQWQAGNKDAARAAWREAVRLDPSGSHGTSARKSLEKNA